MTSATPPELKTDEDNIAFLRNMYRWEIEKPWFTSVPEPEEKYIRGHEDDARSVQQVLLTTYIIKDEFGTDHDARRAARKKLEQEHPIVAKWVSDHSKLRGRKVIGTLYNMDMLMMPLKQKDTALWSLLTEIFTTEIGSPSSRFHEMEFDEKVEYARTVEDAAYRFLAAMTENNGLRRVLTMWRAPSGALYHCKDKPPLAGRTETEFVINRFSAAVRSDSISPEFGIYDVGEVVKNAYLLELMQKCGLERGEEQETLRFGQLEGIVYQQRMGSGIFVAVQHDNDKDYMKLNLVVDNSLVRNKAIETTHGLLQRLAIKKVEAPKPFGY